jgi:hypothetical protein
LQKSKSEIFRIATSPGQVLRFAFILGEAKGKTCLPIIGSPLGEPRRFLEALQVGHGEQLVAAHRRARFELAAGDMAAKGRQRYLQIRGRLGRRERVVGQVAE